MTTSLFSPRAPQIQLFLDADGTVRAEAAGKNGARRKIPGFDPAQLQACLLFDLYDQRAEEKARALEERARLERERERVYKKVVSYTSENYPSALKFVLRDDDKKKKSAKTKPSSNPRELERAIASIQL